MKNFVTPHFDRGCLNDASCLEFCFLERGERAAPRKRTLSVKKSLKKLLPDGFRKRDLGVRPKPSLHYIHPVQHVLPEGHDDPPIASDSDETLIISTPESRAAAEAAEKAERARWVAERIAFTTRLSEQAFAMAQEKQERLKREAEAKAKAKAKADVETEALIKLKQEKELEKSKGKGKLSEEGQPLVEPPRNRIGIKNEAEIKSVELAESFEPNDQSFEDYDHESRLRTEKFIQKCTLSKIFDLHEFVWLEC